MTLANGGDVRDSHWRPGSASRVHVFVWPTDLQEMGSVHLKVRRWPIKIQLRVLIRNEGTGGAGSGFHRKERAEWWLCPVCRT